MRITLILTLLFASFAAFAADESAADAEAKLGLHHESELGYIVVGGNAKSQSFSGKQATWNQWDMDLLKLTGHYLNARAQDQTTKAVVGTAEAAQRGECREVLPGRERGVEPGAVDEPGDAVGDGEHAADRRTEDLERAGIGETVRRLEAKTERIRGARGVAVGERHRDAAAARVQLRGERQVAREAVHRQIAHYAAGVAPAADLAVDEVPRFDLAAQVAGREVRAKGVNSFVQCHVFTRSPSETLARHSGARA